MPNPSSYIEQGQWLRVRIPRLKDRLQKNVRNIPRTKVIAALEVWDGSKMYQTVNGYAEYFHVNSVDAAKKPSRRFVPSYALVTNTDVPFAGASWPRSTRPPRRTQTTPGSYSLPNT